MRKNPKTIKVNKNYLLLLFVLAFYQPKFSFSQDFKIHSHNDYLNSVPFWEAYASESASIEADVILKDGNLFVAHEASSIIKEQTLQSLYLDPILKAKELKIGSGKPFILLIDFKTEAYATLEKLLEILPSYSTLWENTENPFLKIVVSGNRPKTADYKNYPFPLFFDYQSITETENLPLEKIAMFSLNFAKLSQWNGKGPLIDEDRERLSAAIKIAHQFQKPIRFWATPDNKMAWKSLMELGVDYINTDQPYEAKKYLSNLD